MASAQPLGPNYCGRSADDQSHDGILDTIRQDGRSQRAGAATMAEIRCEDGSGAGAWAPGQAAADSTRGPVPTIRTQLEPPASASGKGSGRSRSDQVTSRCAKRSGVARERFQPREQQRRICANSTESEKQCAGTITSEFPLLKRSLARPT